MTFPAKSNMYEVNATSTLEVYGDFVEGTGNELLLTISTRTLNASAREALEKSAAALGYGTRGVAYVATTIGGESVSRGADGPGNASGAGEGERVGVGVGGSERVGKPKRTSDPKPSNCPESTFDFAEATLGASDLLSIIEGLDPLAIMAADAQAAALLERAYRRELTLDAATRIMGRTAVTFCCFKDLLDEPNKKQKAWALLKKLPKLG